MKFGMYLCFVMLVAADFWITDYVIRFPFIGEGNPLMAMAINTLPGGMIIPKTCGVLGLLVFWKKVSPTFLTILCCVMSVVVANNCLLLATY